MLRIKVMGSLPSLRATGHKVWSRIRPNLINLAPRVAAEARLQALRVEVERLSTVRSQLERATQLARVLDAVSAMAEAHGLTNAELDALRSAPVVAAPLGFRQQLKQRATDVVAQVWAQGPLTSISELAFGAATAPAAGQAAGRAAVSDAAASAKRQSGGRAAAAPEVTSANTQSSTAAAPVGGRVGNNHASAVAASAESGTANKHTSAAASGASANKRATAAAASGDDASANNRSAAAPAPTGRQSAAASTSANKRSAATFRDPASLASEPQGGAAPPTQALATTRSRFLWSRRTAPAQSRVAPAEPASGRESFLWSRRTAPAQSRVAPAEPASGRERFLWSRRTAVTAERVAARERGAAPGGSAFVLRVGAGRAAGRAGLQLVAASLLHLPRVHRQLHAVRRGADRAMQSAGFAMQGAGFAMQGAGFALQHVRLPQLAATNTVGVDTLASRAAASIPPRPVGATTTRLLLWSGRSGLQLSYEIASAGAQLLLRRYVLPRVLRYLSSSMAPARGVRRAPNSRSLQNA